MNKIVPAGEEQIVFVDEDGKPTGEVGPKLESHHGNTKLHLAFSCYIFNDEGELLVTQRARSKKVWPGVWTNSVCGHPAPGEIIEDAIKRRADFELGMQVRDIKVMLPNYRYKTPAFDGIIENEFCPVFVAMAATEPVPNPNEVADFRWLPWNAYGEELKMRPDDYSYWSKDQYTQLIEAPSFIDYLQEMSINA